MLEAPFISATTVTLEFACKISGRVGRTPVGFMHGTYTSLCSIITTELFLSKKIKQQQRREKWALLEAKWLPLAHEYFSSPSALSHRLRRSNPPGGICEIASSSLP